MLKEYQYKTEDFLWPEIVPSGQRNVDADSSVFSKLMSSVTLKVGDEEIELLDENCKLNKFVRLCILCAAMGIWSGAKNNQHAGYIIAAASNAPEELLQDGELSGCELKIVWSGNKFHSVQTIDELFQLSLFYGSLLVESFEKLEGKELAENRTKTRGSKAQEVSAPEKRIRKRN